MSTKKISIFLLMVGFLCFLLAGCQGSQIQVAKTSPEVQPLRSETLDVRNCETTKDLHKTLSDFLQVSSQVTISEQAIQQGTENTVDIPDQMCDRLLDAVESAYQEDLKQAQSRLKEVKIDVPADKIYMYQIQWIEEKFQAEISFSMEDQQYQTSYTYALEIPQIDGSKQMSCTA